MLARSAAFDAGYAFVTSYEALEGNGFADRILEAIGAWEKARMDGRVQRRPEVADGRRGNGVHARAG